MASADKASYLTNKQSLFTRFKASKGFQKLKSQGFLDWGSENMFQICLASGDPSCIQLTEQMLTAEAEAKQKRSQKISENNKSNKSDVAKEKIIDSGSSDPKKKKIRIDKGRFVFTDGSPLVVSDEVTESQNKQLVSLLDQKTMRIRERDQHVTIEGLLMSKQAGMDKFEQDYINEWAQKPSDSKHVVKQLKFTQPKNHMNFENKRDKNSLRYRFPLPMHLQGTKIAQKLSDLPGESFPNAKAALTRAKKWDSLSAKTSTFEIVGSRFIIAQNHQIYDGVSRLIQLLATSLPPDDAGNVQLWNIIEQLRKSVLHGQAAQIEFLSSLSELDKLGKKDRLKIERKKLQEQIFDAGWQLPLFENEHTDTDTTVPPLFAGKPIPPEKTSWRQKVISNVTQPAFIHKTNSGNKKGNSNGASTSNANSAPSGGNANRDTNTARRKGKKRKKKTAQMYQCQFCKKKHQVGYPCKLAKRQKVSPKSE